MEKIYKEANIISELKEVAEFAMHQDNHGVILKFCSILPDLKQLNMNYADCNVKKARELKETIEKIKENVARVVLHQSKVTEEQTDTANLAKATEMIKKIMAARNAQAQNQANTSGKSQPVVNSSKKVGRNDPCPCGSGKKYKKCCGANE